jgi:hypothetical protein
MYSTIRLLKKNTRHKHLAKQLQALLTLINYPLGVDGAFGSGTKKVLKQYQADRKLGADGIAGKATWLSLYSDTVSCLSQLCYGDSLEERERQAFGKTQGLFSDFNEKSNSVQSIAWLQSLVYIINEKGQVTGKYDQATQDFVNSVKMSCDMKDDSCVDKDTWQEIFTTGLSAVNQVASLFLTNEIIQSVADDADLDPATIKAVIKVESRGSGFYDDRRPVILFEGHIFWRELKKVGINPKSVEKGNKDIVYPKWVRKHYKGTAIGEFDRLKRAQKIHHNAALRSASWGMFQIMGFNHKASGFSDIQSYIDAMHASEYEHIKAFINFLKKENIYRHLKAKDWANFARRYNGPAYKKNGYDWKLQVAFDKNASGARGAEDQVDVIVNEYAQQLADAFDELSIN